MEALLPNQHHSWATTMLRGGFLVISRFEAAPIPSWERPSNTCGQQPHYRLSRGSKDEGLLKLLCRNLQCFTGHDDILVHLLHKTTRVCSLIEVRTWQVRGTVGQKLQGKHARTASPSIHVPTADVKMQRRNKGREWKTMAAMLGQVWDFVE